MSTVADMRSDLLTKLALETGAQLTNEFTWKIIRPGADVNRWHVETHLVGIDNVSGSNQRFETAEATVRILRRDTAENDQDDWFHSWESLLLDPQFWTDMASVRISPIPEIEITTEPEKIGLVLSIEIKARIALEI